jgi:hypothetical protein
VIHTVTRIATATLGVLLVLETQVDQSNELGGESEEIYHNMLFALEVVEVVLADVQRVQEVQVHVIGDLRMQVTDR